MASSSGAGRIAGAGWPRLLLGPLARLLAGRNLRADRFGTLAAILGVALGTAVVEVVLVLDANTVREEARSWTSNPGAAVPTGILGLRGFAPDGAALPAQSAHQATHEDYQVMRSAIRLGSLSAFLVGALILFFTFAVVIERRRREVALLRSLGALPRQVGAIFVREAVIVGVAGALLGLVLAVPLTLLAVRAGITTTGRSRIALWALSFPKKRMALIAAIGAVTALLGVLRPLREVLRVDVARALRPPFVDGSDGHGARPAGMRLLALPFMLLVYLALRPFFQDAFPSLTFFVLEAGLAAAAFLGALVVVPDLVRVLGAAALRALPLAPPAEHLLTRRRVQQRGHELAWSVSGVMLVFALLMALHVATAALKQEVADWAGEALGGELFAVHHPDEPAPAADHALALLPPGAAIARFSGSTPWPNRVRATTPADLEVLARARGRGDLAALASRLAPGKVILSTMMARRLRLRTGDTLELDGSGPGRRLEVVAVTDGLGYLPIRGPYRNAKTYAVIHVADYDLIAPLAGPPGSDAAVVGVTPAAWDAWLRAEPARTGALRGLRLSWAQELRRQRLRETDRDFVIFDFILGLTSVLASVGIANQLMLSIHGRKREIALYRVLGMTGTQVFRLVLLEGAFVGLLGGCLAALLGVPLGYAAVGALQAVSAFRVEFRLPWHLVPLTILGALAIAVLASLYPARRAARANAAESVHYE